jgi:hypothetical protein
MEKLNNRYPILLKCYPVTEVFGETFEEVFEPLKAYAEYDK